MIGDVVVVVPRLTISVEDLNHPNTPFDQSTGRKATVGEFTFAVGIAGRLCLLIEIEDILGLGLHSECHFQGLDPCLERVVATSSLFEVHLIDLLEQIELLALRGFRDRCVLDVSDHTLWIHFRVVDLRSLVDPREKPIAPEGRSDDRLAWA